MERYKFDQLNTKTVNSPKRYNCLKSLHFQISEEVLCVSNMVKKDVLRTDRHLKFFAGQDDNQNIASLFNILTT